MEVRRLSEEKRKLCVVLKEGGELISKSYNDHKTFDNFSNKERLIFETLLQENNLERDQVQSVYIKKDTDDNCIYISDHAFKRMKERNGWGQKTCLRMVKKIIECGTVDGDIKKIWETEKKKVFITYGEIGYLFINNILVTAYEPKMRKRNIKKRTHI